MRKGKLFTGKAWKRMVRILSCIVVFCTTYALILPAITQEAQAYCGNMEHEHTKECYKEILSCTREEHVHSEDCFDADGNLTCMLEEHMHSGDCYRELLECTEEEHTHSLECFSDAKADLETEEDWKKTLPDQTALKDKTDAEKVLMIAESQKGYKESEKNYIVENETEKKGITRYGQWDEDPYEDWAGAYARFVLHYAGIETADAKKHTSDWLEQLHDKGELKAAEEAEAGDVLFVYDEKDQLKAGIVGEVKDGTVKAWMGDWDNQVQEKTFSKTDEKVHSVWKAIQKEEPADPEQPEGPAEPEVPAEEEQKPEETPKADEEKPAEQPKDEEPVVTYDFTQEVEAEDGAQIKVSWNAGTFETEDVVFQAKKVELTEEEQKKVQEQLDKDKSYTFRNYDLTFYVRDGNMELQKVEPMQPVHVEIELGEDSKPDEKPQGLLHINKEGMTELYRVDDGRITEDYGIESELNDSANESIKLISQSEGITEFVSDSFSKWVIVYPNSDDYVPCKSIFDIRQAISGNHRKIRVTQNIIGDTQTIEVTSSNSSANDPIIIDTCGHTIQSSTMVLKVHNGGQCILTNSKDSEILNAQWDKDWGETDGNGFSFVVFGPENQKKTAKQVGVINSTGTNAIEVYNDNSTLQIEKGVAVVSDKARAIFASAGKSKIYLDESYICHSKGGIALHNGSTLIANNGAVIANNTADQGGGIYADSTNGDSQKIGSSVILNEGCLISSNTASIGGGISIGGDKEFGEGHDTETEWNMATKDESFCSKLEMNGGTIENNTATLREGGGIALIFNSSARAVLRAGTIKNNNTLSQDPNNKDWGGGGIFASQGTFLWMPNGAEITENTSDGLGGGLTGCSTGKIIIDQNLNIYNNTAHGTSFTAGSDKQKDQRVNPDSKSGNYIYDPNYRPVGYEYWNGADIFGAEKTQVITSDNLQMEGIADGQKVVVPGGSTIKSSDWLTLTDPSKQGNGHEYGLKITGNTSATHGGGVLINGWLVSGSSRTIVVGDDIGINAKKTVVNLDGSTANPDKQFKFVITDSLDDEADVLSEGTVSGSGVISFSQRLAVRPSADEAANIPQNATITATYYLREKKGDSSIIQYDSTVYKLDFAVKCTSSQTVKRPVWDPATETFKSEEVTLKEFTIESLDVSKGSIEVSNFTGVTSISNISGSLKTVDLTSLQGSNGTFKNTLIDKQKISVEKKWGDQANHSKDYVTVYLKRYLKEEGQSPETAVIVKAVTLNSDQYRGTAQLPNGVTREYTGTGIWKKSWDEDFQVASENTEYVYLVEEECSNKLYTGTVTSSIDITNGNIPTTTQVDALIPVTSMTPGSDYYIISTFENKMLNVSGYTRDNSWWITPSHKIDVSRIQTVDGLIAYNIPSNSNTYEIRYSNFGTGSKTDGGLSVHPGNITNEGWVYYLDDGYGLVISYNTNYEKSNTKGYQLSNGYLQINVNGGWQDVTYSSSTNSFGTRNKNGGQGVCLYQKGKVNVISGETTGGSANQNFVITNNKASDVKFNLNVIKEDSENTQKLLPGAEFKLSRIEGGIATVIKLTGSTGSYTALADEDYAQGIETVITDANGKISISNLPIGIYELEETKAPEGYALPHDSKDRKHRIEISGESTELDPTKLLFTKKIPNTLLTYELPETGSAGTKVYTATGTILLLTGTSLYRYKRRRNRKGGEAH